MLDIEISNYLAEHKFVVDAQECLMKVLNTSHQIVDSSYDSTTSIMTIKTLDNIFSFKWILGKFEEKNTSD